MATSIDFRTLPYRRGVGACLFNTKGLVLMAERRDSPGSWQMPQGGINAGEDPAATVLRELKEEIGTDSARILARVSAPLRYEFPDWLQSRRLHSDGAGGVVFRGKYRGQEQDWFALLFTGSDNEIKLVNEHEKEAPEFVAWKWMELEQTPGMIVPFKKPVYDAIVQEFAPIAAALKRGESLPE